MSFKVSGRQSAGVIHATTYTLTGPSGGVAGTPSANFTVSIAQVPPTSVPAPVTVTPSDGGGGGTFTPATVSITTGAPSATFTYTPASSGAKTISVTNNGGLTNPANLTYTATAAPPHLLNTLISYWKLDEASGTTPMVDSHGTNNLTNFGGYTSVAGKIGNAPSFDQSGGGQILILADNPTIQVTGDFTWSCWVKNPSGAGNAYVFGKRGATGNDYSLLYTTDFGNGFQFRVHDGTGTGSAISGFMPAAGAWTHIVCWFDSSDGQTRIRINDTTTHASTTSPALAQTAQGLGMACDGDGNAKLGMVLDEVGFWKRKLTAAEITALYNGGAGLPLSSFTA